MMRRRAFLWLCAAVLAGLLTTSRVAWAQEAQEATTRAEEIELARRDKHATLWPERESPLVGRANRLLDRGLLEGIRSGAGNNGWQPLFTGTRSGQGQTFGIGYRRADLFRDALTARATVRGTMAGALLVDGQAEIEQHPPVAGHVPHRVARQYERSPQMDFYGLGRESRKEDRTRYLLETVIGEVRAGYRFTSSINAGVEISGGHVHTGPTSGDDVPSIETIFDATTAPGLFDDTTFLGWGGFAGYDNRDLRRGPRSGGFYGINFNRYVDLSDLGTYTHRRLELEGQHFLPVLQRDAGALRSSRRPGSRTPGTTTASCPSTFCQSSAAASSSAASTSTGSTTTTRSWRRWSIGGTPSPASRWRPSWTRARRSRARGRLTSPG